MDTIYDFYVESKPKEIYIMMFKGTLKDFQKVEQLYGELWYNVIDKQLGLLDFNNGYPVDSLTDDPILLNWEGCDKTATNVTTKANYHYLGDGILEMF